MEPLRPIGVVSPKAALRASRSAWRIDMAARSIVGFVSAFVLGLAAAGLGADAEARQAKAARAVQGFIGDIAKMSERNTDFRRVVYTGKHLQLVLMSLDPGEDLGEETHRDVDQFFRIEDGRGEVVIEGRRTRVEDDDAILVPAGAKHNIVNTGKQPLRFYTIYGPPEHEDRTVQATKRDAAKARGRFDGKTTEPAR
jgi:mannose-6-phosphate isomerase-like protein (cupin superfamily)